MAFGICVLASGRGSNFSAILSAIKSGKCSAKALCLITDNADAGAIKYAKEHGVPVEIVERKNFPSNCEFEEALFSTLEKYSPSLVVLAGYMRIIRSKKILSKYSGKIINIHPSLLPKYPGAHAQKDAFEAGEKISGLTIHLVDETLDGGRILYQEKVDISPCKSSEEVSAKILEREHIAYPRVINDILHGRYK